ncbi:MAG: hypothetical protein R3F62_28695 [Planctomycetota bacterium]
MRRGRWSGVLGVLVVATAWAQDPLEAARGLEPGQGLERVEALLAGELPPPTRIEARRLRAELLARLSRLAEAQAAWEGLLEEGVDVAPELLRLSGAELELRLASPTIRSARASDLTLWGRATGPLAVRLYRVDAARFRDEVGVRALGARLRAPPRTALTRVEAWSAPALADEEHTLRLPPLEPGLYLIAAECRGVRVTRPLFVHDAQVGVTRDVRGLRVVVWGADGAPREALSWALLDAGWRELDEVGAQGPLLRALEPRARVALAWVDEAPVVVALPDPVSRPPVPARLVPELARYRPGQDVRVEVRGGRALAPLRLLAPSGVEVARTLVGPPYGGVSVVRLELPDYAPPGRWTVEHAGTEVTLEVAPRPSGLRELVAQAPAASQEERPVVELRGRWARRGPLSGAEVVLAATWTPASWEVGAAGPLPPWRAGAGGEAQPLEAPSATLDAAGRATVELPTPPGTGVVRVRAWLRDAPEDATWVAFAWGRADLALRLDGPAVVSKDTSFHLEGSLASLSGEGRALRPALLEVRGPTSWNVDLRSDRDGGLRPRLVLPQPGRYRATLRAEDDAGRSVTVAHEVLAVAGPVEPAVAPDAEASAVLRREGEALEVVVARPGARGLAVLERWVEGGEPTVWEAPVEAGVLRARVPAEPGTRVRVALLADGGVAWVELAEAPRAGVVVPVLTVGAEGYVHTRLEGEGRPVAGRVWVTALDPLAARDAARRGGAPWAAEAQGARGSEAISLPAGGAEFVLPPLVGAHDWVHVVARTAEGAFGEAWLERGAPPARSVTLDAPAHLVEGDTADVVLRVDAGLPGAWRVSWEEDGVDLGQPRILAGGRVDPSRSVGARELALDLDGGPLRLGFTLRARRGVEASQAWVRVRALSEDGALALTAEAEVLLIEPGVWHVARWTGFAQPGVDATWPLPAPARARVGRTRLEVVGTPDWATAGYVALRALEHDPRPLAGLYGVRAEEALRGAFRARRLQPPRWDPATRPSLAGFLPRLALSWDPDDAWGCHTADLALELVRLDQAGFAVPPGLRRRALEALDGRSAPVALLARALAGTLQGVTVPDPERTPADALPLLAHALHETGPPARERLVLERALAARDQLTARGAIALWDALREAGEVPPLDLLTDALEDRAGATWLSPATTGVAVSALAEATRASTEEPGELVRVFVEEARVAEAWSGGGLSEWPASLRLGEAVLRPGQTLRVEAKRGPVQCAAVFRARVQRPQPGGAPVARSFRGVSEGPVARVPLGARFELVVELDRDPEPGDLLEVPLPGGCRLADPLPDVRLRDGSLWLAPARRSIRLPLLATVPGAYRVCPTRYEPATGEAGWSAVGRLEVLAPE